jgi:hypothetical protein
MVSAVPQIEGLTVEDMLALAKTSANTLKHLPDERDWEGLNRKVGGRHPLHRREGQV